MADATELRQPGIEVLQVFQTTSPTVFTPTLRACPVGVCKQVVEVITQSDAGVNQLNGQAMVSGPAIFETTNAGPYTALDGHAITIEVNSNAAVTVTFAGTSLSAAQVADQINTVLETNNLYDQAYAEAVSYAGSTNTYLRLRTRSTGASQTIRLACATSEFSHITASGPTFGFVNFRNQRSYNGCGTYTQKFVDFPTAGYPDPFGNMLDLVVDSTTVRTFVAMGTGVQLQEALQTQALLRYGIISGHNHAVTAIAPVDDGDGDALTPIIRFTGESFTAAGTVTTFKGDADMTATAANLANKTVVFDFGNGEQTLVFPAVVANAAAALTELNNAFGDYLTFTLEAVTNYLVVTTVEKGTEAYVKLVSGTAIGILNTLLGLHAFTGVASRGDVTTGVGATIATTAFQPLVGDDVYINGVYVGRIVQVAPGAVVTDLKLDREYAITTTGWTDYYIVARNLPPAPAYVGKRPDPDLTVDATTLWTHLKGGLVRNTQGSEITVSQQIYLAYKALRKDVTVRSRTRPRLMTFDSTTQLETLVPPVTTDNPFALGLYFAILNAPSTQVAGIGVDAYSADEPYGTTEAYTRALTFLESKEVWGIVPLTNSLSVLQLGLVHAEAVSEPEQKGERVCIGALEFPTRGMDTLVSSGTDGNTDTTVPKKFDTGVANLTALALSAGFDPTQTIPVLTGALKGGLYLDIEGDSKHYNVSAINGSVLTIRTSFVAGEDDEQFYSRSALTAQIGTAFSLKARGELLVDTNGDPDYDLIAGTYQDYARSFGSRRLWHIVADTVEAPIDGITQSLPNFYYCAAYAGAISAQPPQQSFTNFPIIGFSKVTGTNDVFTNSQMNRMAAGGNTIVIQDPLETGAIFARMALTTNMQSVETRTDSITKIMDYTAKFVRTGLRTYIGRFNITQNYLDMLSSVLQGQTEFLTGAGVWVSLEVNNLIQDTSQPDTVTLDMVGDPPYPANYIRIRLVI